jgi:trans-aconitate 2-methyltransferase
MNTATLQLPANWEPGPYRQFPEHRLRPAQELLARITVEVPQTIVDLGCGPGHLTRWLAGRWPKARIIGIDSSRDMLAAACNGVTDSPGTSSVEWVYADAAQWCPEHPVDLLFVNSLLHLIEHTQLLPGLVTSIVHGGQLAVQMPDCIDAPWYQLMCAVLLDGGMGGAPIGPPNLREAVSRRLVNDQRFYFDALSPRCSALDIWDTEYLQVLEGEEPVYEWVRAAGLRPVLANLDEMQATQFLTEYRRRLTSLYPPTPDGRTLFPFRRRFIVATIA